MPLFKGTLINCASFFRKYLHFYKTAETTIALVPKEELLVFSVTQFKIDQNKNKKPFNRPSSESGKRKEEKCRDSRQDSGHSNFFSSKICMETDAYQHGCRKPTETSVTEFCY